MVEANDFLEQFRHEFNLRFAKVPKGIVNVHRTLDENEQKQLDTLFTIQTPHKVSKSLTVRHRKNIYKLVLPGKGYRLRQAGVLVCEDESGKITILYNNQPLNYEVTFPRLFGHLAKIVKSIREVLYESQEINCY